MPDDSFESRVHRLCWIDLATADDEAAKVFYCRLFEWTAQDRRVGNGRYSAFVHRDAPVASAYRLTRRQVEHGVPSHWTPYVCVANVDATASKAIDLGGQVIVPPHDVAGLARVSLISDPGGALFGLWQRPGPPNGRHPRHEP
jgi:predicted enzyme related to lactoylglutathione lyase